MLLLLRLPLLLSSLLLLVFGGGRIGVLCDEVRITSVDKLIEFKDDVNSGNNYSGTTVFLDSDLSLGGESFEPIGNDYSKYFLGVFDGQGHVISDLAMNSSSQNVGLFGFSYGHTIRNVILDSSCSITSTFNGSNTASIGGIIGYCTTRFGPCTIENGVNMGSVTFNGNTSSDYSSLYLGGISGSLSYSSSPDSTVNNCGNYGEVTYSGKSGSSYIGGIVGDSKGSSKKVYIYNCLNHGTITHNGTTSNYLRLGGITGDTEYTTIENCVSGEKISLLTNASKNNYIGSIVGYASSDTSINYTYSTSDLSSYNKYGIGTPSSVSNTFSYDSTSFELDETVSIGDYTGTSLIEALNAATDYYKDRDYSRWLLNKGKNAVLFTINGRTNPIKMDYQVILLPSLASEGDMSFDGWFTDDGLTTPLTEFEVTSETELYGKYCGLNFIVTLDVNGGDELTVKEMIIDCDNAYGDLPIATRTGYTFLGWFTGRTGGDKVESGDKVTILSDHTLYAHWSVNKYTLTFDFSNGTEPEVRVLEFNEAITYPSDPVWAGYSFNSWDRNIANMPADNTTITAQWTANNYTVTFNPSGGSASQSTKVVTFGSAYGELPTPNKTGHTFLGWFTEKNESITEESIVKIANNHTLTAQWKETPTSQVEIVFGTKDMTDEKIDEIINKYTDAEFTIIKFEDETTGDITVIVKFSDIGEAEEFVRKVNASEKEGLIKRIGFTSERYFEGFASTLSHQFTLLNIILSI